MINAESAIRIDYFVLYSVISSSCCRYSLAQWKSYFNPRQKIIEGSPRYFDLGLRLSVTYCRPQIYFVRGRGFLVANLEEGYRERDIRSSKIFAVRRVSFVCCAGKSLRTHNMEERKIIWGSCSFLDHKN